MAGDNNNSITAAAASVSSSSTFSNLESFVKHVGAKKAFRKVLLANNGIASIKFIRSVRSWSYSMFGNEKEITFVCMATPEDLTANAEFIRAADMVVHVPGGSNVNNYANVQLIVEIAQQYQVDVVWPGWGHASEHPELPNTLAELGIGFIGPGGKAMHALGDKIQSTILAQSASVPCISWNGDDLKVDYKKTNGEIPPELFDAADVKTLEDARKQIQRIGVPCMIKASMGGGGKGIRVVSDLAEAEAAYRQVQSELPGSPIFIMRMASASRHLEVQLLADQYGQAIALSGRDCSVQRRHQKILEEGPAEAAKADVFLKMEESAVALCKAVGYVNAGTVEYLYSTDDKYYFLELNPRLQVEHPVTEMITGVNLPAAQLQVAMGVPLHRIPDVRAFYGMDRLGDSKIDFDGKYQEKPTCQSHTNGHCIAARITAENPNDGFKPTSGNISEINFRSSKNVWGYFSLVSGSRVHEFSDSQFGHLFAWGENREEARNNLAVALKDLTIRGDIHNTVHYLKDLIETSDYKANQFNTQWLDARIKQNVDTVKTDSLTIVLVGGIATAHQEITAREQDYLAMLGRGQLPPASLLDQTHDFDLNFREVKYKLQSARTGKTTYRITCNDSSVDAELRDLADGGFLILMGGSSHVAYVKDDVGCQRFLIDGETCLFQDEYDPTQMVAQMGGKLLRYLVEDKTDLKKSEPYAEIEVMKMTMQLTAQEDGKIHLVKPEGSVLEPGDIICTMDLKDPTMVKKAELFSGKLPNLGEPWPQALDNMPHQTFERASKKLENVMDGFHVSHEVLVKAVKDLDSALSSSLLPVLEVEGFTSVNKNVMESELVQALHRLCSTARKQKDTLRAETFATDVMNLSKQYPDTQALQDLCKKFINGLDMLHAEISAKLLRKYIQVESKFAELEMSDAAEKDDVMQELRTQHTGNLELVLQMSLSHLSRNPRDTLVLKLMEGLERLIRNDVTNKGLANVCTKVMGEVAALQGVKTTDVALEARQALIDLEHSYTEQLKAIEEKLLEIIKGDTEAKASLITSTEPTLTYLMDIICQEQKYDEQVRSMAMTMYVERVYASYKIVKLSTAGPQMTTEFTFFSEAADSVQVGSGSLTSVSSFDDLSAILSPSGGKSLLDVLEGENAQTSETGSSVGMDLDIGTPATTTPTVRKNPRLSRMNSDFKARAESMSDSVTTTGNVVPPFVERKGMVVCFADLAELEAMFDAKVKQLGDVVKDSPSQMPLCVLHVIIGVVSKSEEEMASDLEQIVSKHKPVLQKNSIRRVTFAVVRGDEEEKPQDLVIAGHGGHFFTFRSSSGFEEDRLVRNIETPLAFQLDLQRLANFNIRLVPVGKSMSRSQTVHIYEAKPKEKKRTTSRYFVRALVRQAEKVKFQVGTYDAYPGPERVFVQALTALESIQEDGASKGRKNHIFMNVLSDSADVNAEYVEGIIRTIHRRYAKRLANANVVEFEIRVNAVLAEGAPSIPIRVIASNPTGFALNIDSYVEATDPNDPRESVYYSISESDGGLGGALAAMGLGPNDTDLISSAEGVGILHGKPLTTPYPIADAFDEKRARASAAGTTYVYDFVDLFRKSLEHQWRCHLARIAPRQPSSIPNRKNMVIADELILDDEIMSTDEITDDSLSTFGLGTTTRPGGRNTIGMVAWKLVLRTPQYPEGRRIVLIANDITTKAGSFGTSEDLLFERCAKYARSLGIPFLYIAANSGARIGMADEVKREFQVKWINENDVSKGYEYLYVDEETYQQLGPEGRKSIICEKVEGTDHYKIETIVGEAPSLGVENLKGSGTIAGETSRAYNEIFTLSYVSGRTVGIGAYLIRLGQRVIQKGSDAPILLTGYQALNSLMGKQVYTSNLQLGGPKVMYTNGVSNVVVRHDMEGVQSMINWLSYVPENNKASLPLTTLSAGDFVDRLVEVDVNALPAEYDPRVLLKGYTDLESDRWISGFFDRDSFMENMNGWAKSVITGRARLGKIPMGVIVSEVRTMTAIAPADPATPDSQESIVSQAGQVWFPDSSFKTAQAIKDFNHEGLPLIIFASFRGFSGGARDMYNEVLKFGSYIVDELVDYKQPVFIYIPQNGTLRGGAYVVVSFTINDEVMEQYADPSSRCGVLEAAGAASIKFRTKDQIATAHRLDHVLIELDAQLAKATDADEVATLKEKIADREKKILPVYHQIAISFADLHDTAGRCLEKGCIRGIVEFKNSRTFFYKRLRRRLAEMAVQKQIDQVYDLYPEGASTVDTKEEIARLFDECVTSQDASFTDDETVYSWLESDEGKRSVESYLSNVRADAIAQQVVHLGLQDSKSIVRGLMLLIGKLSDSGRAEERANLVSILRRGVYLLN